MTRRILPAVLLAGFLISSGQGQVVVNEVMANEPGSYRSLEWIELASASAVATDLRDYVLYVADDTVRFPIGVSIAPGGYLILCRRLVTSDGSASFEGFWGDGSGIWGDTPAEVDLGFPIEADFGLTNSGGAVVLCDTYGELSRLDWTESGDDGVSWERYDLIGDSVAPCKDITGSTPGQINSITPVDNDLAVTAVRCSVADFTTTIRITVSNLGRLRSEPAELTLVTGDELMADGIESLGSGADTTLETSLLLADLWTSFEISLPEDDRPANNRYSFFAPGGDYPPLIVTEFLPNPQDGLESEWVEVYNRSDQSWDLGQWQIGDSRQSYALTGAGSLQPGERIVLAQDGSQIRSYYPALQSEVAEPVSWSRLNDDLDTVRLIDPYGLMADACPYDQVYDDNYTWSRGEDDDHRDLWGRSERPGGSPGALNEVVFAEETGSANIEILPQIFSPDGDGFDDSCLIRLSAPDLTEYQLRIFDRSGREVRDLKSDPYRRDEYYWNGRDNSGNRVRVGMYVVCFEVSGSGACKAPVVVAR